jgi:hypothetical protein
MKRPSIAVLMIAISTATLFAKDKNPADYPLTAHVLSATGNAAANPLDKTTPFTVRFQVGNLVYTCGWRCLKHVQVGSDVHARIEKRKIHILTDDGQTCETRVESVIELTKN